jgi:hypothetical protein
MVMASCIDEMKKPTQRKNETCVNQTEEIMSKAQKKALAVRKQEL